MIGLKFNRLTVIGGVVDKRVTCLCECGEVTRVKPYRLRNQTTKSCGCWARDKLTLRNTSHGKSNTKAYAIWKGMKRRCYSSKEQNYKYYGGQGIKICDRWLDFNNFYIDMGDPPPGMSIERENVKGDYCLDNCVWLPLNKQQGNTRNSVFVAIDGRTQNLAEWCRELGQKYYTVASRINRNGWTPERALLTRTEHA